MKSFPELIGSGNPEAHDYASGVLTPVAGTGGGGRPDSYPSPATLTGEQDATERDLLSGPQEPVALNGKAKRETPDLVDIQHQELAPTFLIAHKVRGELAFDVAERCDSMGSPSDPGPWWIIPTSGHRAYPFAYWRLEDLFDSSDYPHARPWDAKMPEGLRDHYQVSEKAVRPKKELITEINLEELGL